MESTQYSRREFTTIISTLLAIITGLTASQSKAVAAMDTNKPSRAIKSKRRGKKKDNSSWWIERQKWNEIEKALAEQWEHDNIESPGLNYGHGILQDLMLSTWNHEKPAPFDPWLTDRERKIVATVIQWLGTNVGRGFLYEASRRMSDEKRRYFAHDWKFLPETEA